MCRPGTPPGNMAPICIIPPGSSIPAQRNGTLAATHEPRAAHTELILQPDPAKANTFLRRANARLISLPYLGQFDFRSYETAFAKADPENLRRIGPRNYCY
ncbi:unnamed protein product [Colias eurytheme]|nr:unnamed protein product [Colias eurytheme]